MSTEMQLRDVEGVQFFTDNEGNAGLSQNGLAKLCGVARHTVAAYLGRDRQIGNKTAETVTDCQKGVIVSNVKIVDADTCVTTIEYYAFEAKIDNTKARDTFRKFAAIGFTKWVQTVTGYEPAQKVAAKVEMTDLEMVNQHIGLLQAKAEQIAYLQDKPGLAHKMAQAHSSKELPCEKLSFDELCDLRGYQRFDVKVKRELSRKLANAVSNDLLSQVGTKTVTIGGKTKPQYYQVKAYPIECLAAFDNVMATFNQG